MTDDKLFSARTILEMIGMPRGQLNDRTALTLLALGDLRPGSSWEEVTTPLVGVTPIMAWCAQHYGTSYAPNTRETFRRFSLHQLVQAGVVLYNPDKPGRAVNSPRAVYQLSPAAVALLKSYGTPRWNDALQRFKAVQPSLAGQYAAERQLELVPVSVAEGKIIRLSPGVHSELIRDIVESFAPSHTPGARLIYVGDTGDKVGYFDEEFLAELGVVVDRHGKMPDVVLYHTSRRWLVLVESVTSHGPVDGKRHLELKALFSGAKVGLVFVTAFPDRGLMSRYLPDIAWETEVWVSAAPTHLIHFNGERFLGPYES